MNLSNTMPTMCEAQDQVLLTTELLEAILERLPPAATFRAQQVCKHWQAVIKTSSTLQRKLCLKADPDDALTWVNNDTALLNCTYPSTPLFLPDY